jgi:hypothetical protein
VKALTLTQPWATLVAIGAKTIETRSWPTAYRGSLAIHAAKGLSSIGGEAGLFNLCCQEPFRTALYGAGVRFQAHPKSAIVGLPRGAIVATCEIAYCLPTEEMRDDIRVGALVHLGVDELAFGDYSNGRYAWRLARVQPLDEPIPCRGALGLWDAPSDLLPLIESRAREREAVSPLKEKAS